MLHLVSGTNSLYLFVNLILVPVPPFSTHLFPMVDPWGRRGRSHQMVRKTCYQTSFGASNHNKINSGWGYALDSTGELTALPRSPSCGEGGGGCPSPKTPSTASALKLRPFVSRRPTRPYPKPRDRLFLHLSVLPFLIHHSVHSLTPSLFHSLLKTYLFHKSLCPPLVSRLRPDCLHGLSPKPFLLS